MRHRTRNILVGAVALTLIGGTAYAVTSTTPNPINACVSKSGGNIRIVSSTGQCKSNEAPYTWNTQGTPGTNGTNGTNGVSGYEIVTKEQPESALAFFGSVSASCPAGKKVTGGGALATTSSGGVQDGYAVLNSSPLNDTGWRATFNIDNPLNDDFVLKVYAICATV